MLSLLPILRDAALRAAPQDEVGAASTFHESAYYSPARYSPARVGVM
jgi:hypothetical protein